MSRGHPRETSGLFALQRPVRPPEQPGQKTVGPASKRLALLLESPRVAVDVEGELDRLATARAESRAFILDMMEGEP